MKFLSPVVHDHPDVNSLLFNTPEGSYVVHRDKTRNNDRNPLTIHVVKKSHRTGWNMIAVENIHFDTQNQEYSLVNNRDIKYQTIESLIENNKALLKFNLMLDLDNIALPPLLPPINPSNKRECFAQYSTNQNDGDILGNKAPTNLGIRYNLEKKEIHNLLRGHPDGTFIIHQSRYKNEVTKPYTIYANKTSERDGRVRLAPAYIVYHETTKQFSVGQAGRKYSTLQALINGNKRLLKSQLT